MTDLVPSERRVDRGSEMMPASVLKHEFAHWNWANAMARLAYEQSANSTHNQRNDWTFAPWVSRKIEAMTEEQRTRYRSLVVAGMPSGVAVLEVARK